MDKGKPQQRFPREARLLDLSDFTRVNRRGRKIHTRHYIILVVCKKYGPTRLGLTVSRKVGGAVQRNRVKRLLREFFRCNRGDIRGDLDISIIAKRGAHRLSLEDVGRELEVLRELNDCRD